MLRTIMLVLGLLLVTVNAAHAEEVRLKSGIVKSGEIIEKTDQDITLKDGGDMVTIPFSMVAAGEVKALQGLPNKALSVVEPPAPPAPALGSGEAEKANEGAREVPGPGEIRHSAGLKTLGQIPVVVPNSRNVRLPRNTYEVTRADPGLPVSRGPRKTITLDRLQELRSMLKNHEFEKLNAALDEYQKFFEKDQADEYYLYDAYYALAFPDPASEEAFKSWVRAWPERYQPYLAIAQYYENRGWKSRGSKFINETTQEQVDGMLYYFVKAVDNLKKALRIKSNLHLAYMVHMSIAKAVGDEAASDKLSAQATELFPYSFLVRMNMKGAREPRWGGSYREMEAFAKSAEQYAYVNPELTLLYAFIYEDQAQYMERNSRYEEALYLLDKALAFGDRASLYTKKARIFHVGFSDYENALINANKSLELRPLKIDALLCRSRIYFDQGNYDASLKDLQTAELINPNDDDVKAWKKRMPNRH